MQLRFQEYDDFIALNKPFGVRTHRVSDNQFGFVEFLSEKLTKDLLVVHRLDKETSGVILFAKNKQAAAKLSELFESQEVKKTYYFLTDHKNEQTEFVVKSHISKQDEFFINLENFSDNSETHFEFVKALGKNFLWRAFPKTGKTHQIRLHAQKAGLSILGDNQHGGSTFFRLALHAAKIEFTLNHHDYSIESELPDTFKNAGRSILNECYNKRHGLYDIAMSESYRLIHHDVENLRADVFGDRLWVYDYSPKGLGEEQRKKIAAFAESKKLKPLIRHMLDRGQGVGGLEQKTLDTEDNSNWIAEEEKVRYSLKTDSGFSPGLFLDQRENRLWTRQNSANKNVLNLFCYTSGFSVNAALGKAQQVTSVDVSKKFLDWSKENFALNQIDTAQHEFFAQDCLLFLKGSIKRNRKWDLIICDPPSFGRSKDAIWKLESSLPELAELMFECLEPNGQILFTCNLEKRTRQDIINLFSKKIKANQPKISRMPMMSLDYELTDDLTNIMKGFIAQKAQEVISKA
jgi:23S rRNA (cytosine1962-C5)-methyltransferase